MQSVRQAGIDPLLLVNCTTFVPSDTAIWSLALQTGVTSADARLVRSHIICARSLQLSGLPEGLSRYDTLQEGATATVFKK